MALKGVMVTLTIVTVVAALVLAEEKVVEEENGFNVLTNYGRDIIGHGERMIIQLVPTKRMTRKQLKFMENTDQGEETVLVLPPPVPECVNKPCEDDDSVCKPDCRCVYDYRAGPGNDEAIEPEIKCQLKDETDIDTDEE